ncbi:MAG: bile acid:sodium symporter, partial [Arenicella sp.]|nr:bile acid:sodium symporter [Arenicella sp.]
AMATALALMMFSVALTLRVEHFRAISNTPLVFLAGIAGQIIALPMLTLVLCFILQPIPSVALGMILVACCPGGNVSNILVLLARGNTALSVSLTATSSIAAAFITPLSILFWSSLYSPTAMLLTTINFEATAFLVQTSIILAAPLVSGMLCSALLPAFSARIQRPLISLSSLLLIAIIVFTFFRYWEVFVILGASLLGIVALHNALAFVCGNLIARFCSASVRDQRALTFEIGIQNSGLGIVILLTQLGGLGGAAAVAGLWGTWHIVAGLGVVALFRYSDR